MRAATRTERAHPAKARRHRPVQTDGNQWRSAVRARMNDDSRHSQESDRDKLIGAAVLGRDDQPKNAHEMMCSAPGVTIGINLKPARSAVRPAGIGACGTFLALRTAWSNKTISGLEHGLHPPDTMSHSADSMFAALVPDLGSNRSGQPSRTERLPLFGHRSEKPITETNRA